MRWLASTNEQENKTLAEQTCIDGSLTAHGTRLLNERVLRSAKPSGMVDAFDITMRQCGATDLNHTSDGRHYDNEVYSTVNSKSRFQWKG